MEITIINVDETIDVDFLDDTILVNLSFRIEDIPRLEEILTILKQKQVKEIQELLGEQ